MKIINGIFAIFFLLSAYLQHNDVDPFLWISIYIFGTLLCLLAILGKDNRFLHYTALVIFLSFATYLFFSPTGVLTWYYDHGAENIAQSMSADKPYIEETREFFGLVILSSASLLNLIFRRREFESKRRNYQNKYTYRT